MIATSVARFVTAAILLGATAGCGRQTDNSASTYQLAFASDDKVFSWAPNKPIERTADANDTSDTSINRAGDYEFELVPIGNPKRHILIRRQRSTGHTLTIESPARSRTVIKAEWLRIDDDQGIAYSADFNADDRYELYWLPNKATASNEAIRMTPTLGLGADVVNWWPVKNNHVLVQIKQARLSTLKLIELGENGLNSAVVSQTQFPLDAGPLDDNAFWYLSQQKLNVLTSSGGALSPTRLGSYNVIGWLQKFPSSTGVGFDTPEGYRVVIGRKSFDSPAPVLDGIQCGEQSWLVSWKDKQPVITHYKADRKVESVSSPTLPLNLRCERQRSK